MQTSVTAMGEFRLKDNKAWRNVSDGDLYWSVRSPIVVEKMLRRGFADEIVSLALLVHNFLVVDIDAG